MIRRIPYPLPQKRQKLKSGIERAPQRIWLRHRKFVRSHQCCVPGCTALMVDVAHLRGVNNAGTSLKPADFFTVPLCRHHHLEQEPIGPDAFGDRHGIDLWAIAAELVRRSPDTKMRLAYLEWQADQLDERERASSKTSVSPLAQQGAATPGSLARGGKAPAGYVAKPQDGPGAHRAIHTAHRALTVQLIPLRGMVR